jgi:hypothetical protein
MAQRQPRERSDLARHARLLDEAREAAPDRGIGLRADALAVASEGRGRRSVSIVTPSSVSSATALS